MNSVVLFSVHCYQSPQRAGFHWLADAFWRDGWDVTFVTASLSQLSRLRRDRRLCLCGRADANRLMLRRPRFWSFSLVTLLHPVNLRFGPLNWAARPLLRHYGDASLGELESVLRTASLVIFESSACLMLARRVRDLNPSARLVYRASDDLRYNGNPPLVLEEEQLALDVFDLVSAPSPSIFARFEGRANARLQYHGVDILPFQARTTNPYPEDGFANAIFVGMSRIDRDFFRLAPRLAKGWRFHVIGPVTRLPDHPRLVRYGMLPFGETVPYIQHADVGLHTLEYAPGAEAFSDSLKALQYTYCSLPVVAPEFLRSRRNNGVYYRPGDGESIVRALTSALSMDRRAIDRTCVRSARELARELAGEDLVDRS